MQSFYPDLVNDTLQICNWMHIDIVIISIIMTTIINNIIATNTQY